MEDNFGRKVDRMQVTAQELLAETQTVTINSKESGDASYEKLTAVMDELSKKVGDLPLQTLISSASAWTSELVKLREEIGLFRKSDNPKETGKSYDQALLDNFKKFHADLKNRDNGLWFGISRFSEVAQSQLLRTLKKIFNPNGAGDTEPFKDNVHGGGRGGRGGGGGGQAGFAGDGMDPALLAKSSNKLIGTLGMVAAGFIAATSRHAIDIMGMHWTDVFTGMKDLVDYSKNLDMLLYQKNRVAFDENQKFAKLQHVGFGNLVQQTGASANEIQHAWIETLKRGNTLEEQFTFDKIKKEHGVQKAEQNLIRRRERLMKDSVFTATYLNMGIDSVNDMFNDWHTELGFSTEQMSTISKEMINISRSTGLVGANLEKALRSSEGVMKSMRGQGLLNTSSAKNIMKMTADFQRFGFGEEGQAFLQKLTNGAALNDSKFGSLAARMSGGDQQLFVDIASGRSLNKISNRKAMKQNLESNLLSDVRGVIGEGQAKSIEAQLGEPINIANLQKAIELSDSETQLRLNTIIEQIYDNDIMAVAAIVKTFEESSKSYEDQVKDLDNQINKHAGKTGIVDKLQKKKSNLEEEMLSTGFNYFREEMERNNGNEIKARAALQKRMSEEHGEGAGKLFSNLDGSYHKMIGHLREQAKAVGKDFDVLLKEQGVPEEDLLKLTKSADVGDRNLANEALDSIRQEILTKERAEQNPYKNMEQYLKEINGFLQESLKPLLASTYAPWLGIFGSIAASIGGFLIQFGLLANGLSGLSSIGGWIKGKLGFGGKPPIPGGKPTSGTPPIPSGKSKVYEVNGKKTIDVTGRRVPSTPDISPPKSGWNKFTEAWGGGGKAGGKGKAKWLPWLLALAGGTVAAGSWLTSGGGEANPSDGTGIPAMDGPLPVYVVNWEEICKCTGGANTTMPAGTQGIPVAPPTPTTTTLPEQKKTGFQNTSDGITAVNNASQWGMGAVAGGKWATSKIIGKAGKEVGEELVKKAGGKIAGRVVPGLDIGIDAIAGAAYAEENNRGTIEGGILGGLTGDSSVGSQFFSPLLGIEENTMWDKMMGVFGSGLRGTLSGMTVGGTIGAAAGAPVAGAGAIPGAGIGALVGGAVGGVTGVLAELYKLWTDDPLPINPPQTITIPINKKKEEYKPSPNESLINANENRIHTSASYANGLDYSEETQKPYISASTYNKEETVAAMLEKQRVPGKMDASMPDMSSVNDYLTKTQADKLDSIIDELRGIRTNTTMASKTLVDSSPLNAGIIASRSNMKRAAEGMTRGVWGLQAGPNTQNDVVSDGRYI